MNQTPPSTLKGTDVSLQSWWEKVMVGAVRLGCGLCWFVGVGAASAWQAYKGWNIEFLWLEECQEKHVVTMVTKTS